MISVVEYRPNQVTSVVQTKTFDDHIFIAFALEYQLDGDDQLEMCNYNMEVARKLNQTETVQFWKIIKLFLESDPISGGTENEQEQAKEVFQQFCQESSGLKPPMFEFNPLLRR